MLLTKITTMHFNFLKLIGA